MRFDPRRGARVEIAFEQSLSRGHVLQYLNSRRAAVTGAVAERFREDVVDLLGRSERTFPVINGRGRSALRGKDHIWRRLGRGIAGVVLAIGDQVGLGLILFVGC